MIQRIILLCAAVFLAAAAPNFQAAVVLNEFMAENDGFLHDQDGDSPDWIELHNNSLAAVNLAGWHLTDTPTNLTKWTFPAVEIPSGGFLLVFASGKDRAVAGAELHANFQLENGGGYLALVEPDGATIATAFTNYPTQHRNVSFGPGFSNSPSVTLLTTNAPVAWFIPTNDLLGTSWTASGFDASTWALTNTPLRYEVTLDGGAVKIDVNQRAANTADNTQAGFQAFTMTAASGAQSTPSTRNFGPVSVTVSSIPSGINYDDRLRGTPSNGGSLTTEDIYRDFIFSAYNAVLTNGLDILIAGLGAGQQFQVTVWSFDSGSGTSNRISDWSANGVLVTNNYSFIGSTLPATDNANKIIFNATVNPSGQILISARRDIASLANQPAVFLNALQLIPIPPMPATNGNVAALAGQNSGLYARQSFTVADPSAFNQLILRMRSDDAFVAYLNGTEVARRRAPATTTWNSAATTTNSAISFEDIVLPGAASLLVMGSNVLAVHGLNVAAGDDDFFIEPQLIATFASPTPGNYLALPSPGTLNNAGFLGVVADTKFSVNRGFYEAPFSLSITCATAGASIYFTTNGSPPSLTNGFLFTSPINIEGQSFIRAAAFLPDWISSGIDTHTYVFLRDVLRQSNNIPGYPANWIQQSYPADYEMDSNVVNHPFYGQTLSNDLRSIPVLSIVTEFDGLWGPTRGIYTHPTSLNDLDLGQDWERAASAELILPEGPNGETAFAANCAVRIQGNASRDNVRTPKHSFRLLFKSSYGPSKLQYDWFPGPVDEFDNIILRAAGFVDGWPSRYSDTNPYVDAATGQSWFGTRYRPETGTYLRDLFAKASHRDMGWTASRSDWVHLYLNGLYWGIYNPSERLDSTFVAKRFGGWEQDWDVLVGDDALFNAAVADGSKNDWNVLMGLLNSGVTSEPAYAAITNLVDINSLIDYFLLHIYVEAEDWPNHNWYAAHRHANLTNGLPVTKWQFFTWDQEVSLDRNVRRDRSAVANADTPARIYSQLRAWPEFNRQFGDRVQKHLFDGGALTPSNNVARFATLASVITNAINGESARWGDAREFPTPGNATGTGKTFTRDEWWVPELQKLWTNLFPALHDINIARLRAAGLYPQLDAPAFNQFGGNVSNGFALIITHTNASGTIYFTTDGTDPRVYGSGAVAAGAQAFSAPVAINTPTLVRARVLNGASWSALVEAVFYPPQDLSKLALTELMYHPPDVGITNSDEFEFVELKNTGTNTLNLSGLTFSGISFTFTNGTTLAPGEFFVLVRNSIAFASKHPGVMVNGVYTGRLDNGGETITLSHALGGTIFSVAYDDSAPWSLAADGFGFSLVPINPGLTQAPDSGIKWRASTFVGGSPGADDPAPGIAPIVINEILTHSSFPFTDMIELFNPTGTNVNIGGWFLSDDPAIPKKYRITDGTTILAGNFITFDESQFNPTPGTNGSFSLSSSGEQLYLLSGDANTNLTGYGHGLTFAGAANNVSFGRHINSAGEEQFPAQPRTFGNTNAPPLVQSVVINEIHYNPSANGDEFIELKNTDPVNPRPLFDAGIPTNTWSLEGVDFTFTTNTVIAPNSFLLIVATNPASFRLKYSVPANIPIVGPYFGTLQNSGERIELKRVDLSDTNAVRYAMDSIRYNDKAPWPPAADGAGPSLQRLFATQYGDDPMNWQAAAPTPGLENAAPDTDGDGMPDNWEMANGTNPAEPDANADPDGDGHSNYQEYLAGTNPLDPGSQLRVERVTSAGGAVQFEFTSVSNRTFTVQFKDTLEALSWSVLTNVPAAPQTRVINISVPPTNSARFYRVGAP